MENKQNIYDFCEKCGALMKNGACTACGYVQGQQPEEGLPREIPEAVPVSAKTQEHRKTFLIGSCIGVAVFVVLLCVSLFMISDGLKTAKPDIEAGLEAILGKLEEMGRPEGRGEQGSREFEDSKESGDTREAEETEEDYVPDRSDDFYVEIADAVRTDLSYQIEWEECDLKSDRADASFYTVYPQLVGDIPHGKELNEYISQEALFYREYCEMYVREMGYTSCHIQSSGYVTYMDEDTVSIVFEEMLILDSTGIPGLFDINIDLSTGTVLEHEGMISYTKELAQRFRSQNEYQNNEKLKESDWTDEQLRQLLEDSGGIVFFTPVGLEIGFNYNGAGNAYGWVTVTLKDYEKYMKKI